MDIPTIISSNYQPFWSTDWNLIYIQDNKVAVSSFDKDGVAFYVPAATEGQNSNQSPGNLSEITFTK